MTPMLAAVFFLFLGVFSEEICFDEVPKWTSEPGHMKINGHIFNLKGVNWWGAQGMQGLPLGMPEQSIAFHLDILQKNDFNALRYAVSARTVLEDPETKYEGKKAMDVLEEIIDECAKRGILVMLDMHGLGFYDASPLWYNADYPEAKALEAWDGLMDRFATKWNVFAIDLMNEPHGEVSWGDGNIATDWQLAAQRFINHIDQKHQAFQGLFFVEGKCCGANKGRGFDVGLKDHPIATGKDSLDKRVVYSPHHYRPGRQFPDAPAPKRKVLWAGLDIAFGQVVNETGRALVFGEWGLSVNNKQDMSWATNFRTWLHNRCLSDTFYWSLQGGKPDRAIISESDMKTVDKPKLRFLATFQPNPSKMSKKDNNICIEPGKPIC